MNNESDIVTSNVFTNAKHYIEVFEAMYDQPVSPYFEWGRSAKRKNETVVFNGSSKQACTNELPIITNGFNEDEEHVLSEIDVVGKNNAFHVHLDGMEPPLEEPHIIIDDFNKKIEAFPSKVDVTGSENVPDGVIDETSHDSTIDQMVYSQEDLSLFKSDSSDEDLLASFSSQNHNQDESLYQESDLDDDDLMLATLRMEIDFRKDLCSSTPTNSSRHKLPLSGSNDFTADTALVPVVDEVCDEKQPKDSVPESSHRDHLNDSDAVVNQEINFQNKIDLKIKTGKDACDNKIEDQNQNKDVMMPKLEIDETDAKPTVPPKTFIYPLNSSGEKVFKPRKVEPADFSVYTCEFSASFSNEREFSPEFDDVPLKSSSVVNLKNKICSRKAVPGIKNGASNAWKEVNFLSKKNNAQKTSCSKPVSKMIRLKRNKQVFPSVPLKKKVVREDSFEITNAVLSAKAQLMERNRLIAQNKTCAAVASGKSKLTEKTSLDFPTKQNSTLLVKKSDEETVVKPEAKTKVKQAKDKGKPLKLRDDKKELNAQVKSDIKPETHYNQLRTRTVTNLPCLERPRENSCLTDCINVFSVNDEKGKHKDNGLNSSEFENFTMDSIYARILKWNVNWLEEQEIMKDRPPPLFDSENALIPVLDSYLSVEEYFNINCPLLMHELWEEISKGWRGLKQGPQTFGAKRYFVINMCTSKSTIFSHLFCQVVGLKSELPQRRSFMENDLVALELRVLDSNDVYPAFGIISKSTRNQNLDRLNSLLRTDEICSNWSQYVIIDFVVKIRFRKIHYNEKIPSKIQVIASLSSFERRFGALLNVRKLQFLSCFLEPHPLFSLFSVERLVNEVEGRFNAAQHLAVCEASSLVTSSFDSPKIYLLQGPPGTGKSQTIVGIIANILRLMKKRNREGKILLCAPSNGGCDEIARRLIPALGENGIIRVGRAGSMDSKLSKIFLENIVQEQMQKQMENGVFSKSASLQKNIAHKENVLADLENQLKYLDKRKDSARIEELNEKISVLHESLNRLKKFVGKVGLNDTARRIAELNLREQLLKDARIVICTLNFSGSCTLNALLPERNAGCAHFDCIVVDEAAQSLEVESLIPLRFGMKKIILVGDPEQLPATVLSKVASEAGLGQSLFQRFYQRFAYEDSSPIRMLTEQYRMHPALCEFPSKHIYRSKLFTNPKVAEKRKKFPFAPYLVFNVEMGSECCSDSGSMSNEKEVYFVVKACCILTAQGKVQPNDIGVISFYQQQVLLIRQQLQAAKINNLEVNTVDSYQGREKDVIILSCVRANHCATSIGFVANRQRMNVALTRAKYALYVFGHLDSLRIDENWSALIADAAQRRVIVNVRDSSDLNKIQRPG